MKKQQICFALYESQLSSDFLLFQSSWQEFACGKILHSSSEFTDLNLLFLDVFDILLVLKINIPEIMKQKMIDTQTQHL